MAEALAGDVKVPGVGKKVSKKYLVIVGGVAAAFVGYRWYSTPTGAASVIDPSSADMTMPVGGDGQAVPGGSDGAYGDSSVDASYAAPTNATWAQEAQRLLEGVGFDSMFTATALGAYLNNQSLTATQAAAVQTALAMNGRPPSGSFSIRLTVTPDPVANGHAGDVPVAAPTASPSSAPVAPTSAAKGAFSSGPIVNAIPTASTGSVSTKPSGTATGLTAGIRKDESMPVFQGRIFAYRGFSPTLIQLKKLNPGQSAMLDKINNGEKHPEATFIIS